MRDIEEVLEKLSTETLALVNARITAINAQKNDSIVLDQLNAGALITSSQDIKNKSYNPFILVQLASVETEYNGLFLAEKYAIEVLMFMQDDYSSIDSWKRALRYWRAMKEGLLPLWDKLSRGSQVDMESLAPIDIQVNNSSNPMKVFGVELSYTIA